MGYVYKITNLINDKKYIGITQFSVESRWKEHLYAATKTNIKYALYKAMRKYGIQNFKIETLEEVPLEELYEKEKYYIALYDTFIKNEKGYNLTLGGEGHSIINNLKVYELWDEGLSIKQICDYLGHDRSSIRKILSDYENYSLEESNKRGDSIQGLNRLLEVYQFSLDGTFIAKYNSRKEAEEKTGIKASAIWAAIKSKGTSGGFQWCYKEDKDTIKPKKGRKYRQKVVQKNKEGQIVEIYESAAEASRKTNISATQIRNVCQGKGYTAGGYYWSYKGDD